MLRIDSSGRTLAGTLHAFGNSGDFKLPVMVAALLRYCVTTLPYLLATNLVQSVGMGMIQQPQLTKSANQFVLLGW